MYDPCKYFRESINYMGTAMMKLIWLVLIRTRMGIGDNQTSTKLVNMVFIFWTHLEKQ